MNNTGEIAQPPPLPTFSCDTAIEKVRLAENGWNTCEPSKVALAYTHASCWRNRSEFIQARTAIIESLTRKWKCELNYGLMMELWTFEASRAVVRFAYEFLDDFGNWFRAYENENLEFDSNWLMHHRHICINDLPIKEVERKFHWDRPKPRAIDHPGLTDLAM